MKNILTIGFCLAILCWSSCTTKKAPTNESGETASEPQPLVVEKGKIEHDTLYVNKTPAISFAIDSSWHVASDQELAAMVQHAASFVEGKAVLDNQQSVVVFVAKQYETGVPREINDSFMCAVNGRDVGGQHFDRPDEYLDYLKNMYRTMLPPDMTEKMEYQPATKEKINGKTFDMLEMSIALDAEKTLTERHYILFSSNYILDFTVKFSPEEDHAQLFHMIGSIQTEEAVQPVTK